MIDTFMLKPRTQLKTTLRMTGPNNSIRFMTVRQRGLTYMFAWANLVEMVMIKLFWEMTLNIQGHGPFLTLL